MEIEGWIFDLYPSVQGMTLWLIEANQKRHRLIDRFVPAFCVAGAPERLRRLAAALEPRHALLATQFVERTDLWRREQREVLEVSVSRAVEFSTWAHWVRRFDSSLELFNSDLMPVPLYCWERGVFPLARVEAEADEEGRVRALACRDNEWSLDYEVPPLEVLHIRPSGARGVDPEHGRCLGLEVEVDGRECEIDGRDEPAALSFARLLRQHDPDLILSDWGDATLLPLLARQAERLGKPLALNRDADAPAGGHTTRARSYMSYGRMMFKNSATTLAGRLHVDTRNSFIADKCDLAGLWELVRITRLPVQYAARTSTGTGISYMQMELAWRDGVLIPEQKAEPEEPKPPDALLAADRGGLVFVPQTGFFAGVGELDFVSEYPSIMARFNISPETVNCPCCLEAPRVPELGYRVCQRRRGITSRVVERLVEKRAELKERIRNGAGDKAPGYKLQRDAMKWLLVCCFGYTGYKNARFGRIEAHEAINAVARETLLVAKELAEESGFCVLHALVDSLYVQKDGAAHEEYEGLARRIEQRTRLPISVEALYRYVVFMPSRQFADVPVPNRFFAVGEDGELKVRGLESRRHDTPPIVARMQREVLDILAEAHDAEGYVRKLAEAREVFLRYDQRLADGSVAIEDLVIRKRLTRAPRDYNKAAHTAIAAQQLAGRGVKLRPGEVVEYILTDVDARLSNDRVRALTLWEGWFGYDRAKYRELLRDAFEPFVESAPEEQKATITRYRGQSQPNTPAVSRP